MTARLGVCSESQESTQGGAEAITQESGEDFSEERMTPVLRILRSTAANLDP